MHIVCIHGPRASGKLTLIQRIQETAPIPFIHFDGVSDHLCHWWERQRFSLIHTCIVFDELIPAMWNSHTMTEIFTMSRHYNVSVIWTTHSLNQIPRFFRVSTNTTIVCPDQRNDPLDFTTLFASNEPVRHRDALALLESPMHYTRIDALRQLRAALDRLTPVGTLSRLEQTSDAVLRDLPDDAVCPITLQTINKGQYFTECTQCHNVFDYDAIAMWAKKSQSCPMCRKTSEIWKCYR